MDAPQITFQLPGMYGDHHVVKVRQIVAALPGVVAVIASAALQRIDVKFDPAQLSAEAIASALSGGGYPPGAAPGFASSSRQSANWRRALRAAAAPSAAGTRRPRVSAA